MGFPQNLHYHNCKINNQKIEYRKPYPFPEEANLVFQAFVLVDPANNSSWVQIGGAADQRERERERERDGGANER